LRGNFNRFKGGHWHDRRSGGGGFSKVQGNLSIRRSQGIPKCQSLFHRDPARRDELTGTLRGRFGKWLESLRKSVTNSPAGFQPEDATMLD
jgi:hypothetical protein